MTQPYDYFVILAGMRTGSNLLETYLNDFPNIECHGEAFNPVFVGSPKKDELFSITLKKREADPFTLIELIKDQPGMNGFRYFNDHDPRVFDHCLSDPRCAKIILTRNPLESYVSYHIAKKTEQWQLTNPKFIRSSKISFNAKRFQKHLAAIHKFHGQIKNNLQITGQTAFYIDYDDLKDLKVINGLASFLGEDEQLVQLSNKLKKQNPESLHDKVENYDEMLAAISKYDFFNLSRFPNYEPDRGPAVPRYVAAAETPLLYVPIAGGPNDTIRQWLVDIDGTDASKLVSSFNQKTLRQWKKSRPGHRTFTVLRHPVSRAHHVFCKHIIPVDENNLPIIREYLRNAYQAHLPKMISPKTYTIENHRHAFLAFLKFLKVNLNGQTVFRVDALWASQSNILAGISKFGAPDIILREEALPRDLNYLANQFDKNCQEICASETDKPYELAQIYDNDIENAVQSVYKKDYIAFGFTDWANTSGSL